MPHDLLASVHNVIVTLLTKKKNKSLDSGAHCSVYDRESWTISRISALFYGFIGLLHITNC